MGRSAWQGIDQSSKSAAGQCAVSQGWNAGQYEEHLQSLLRWSLLPWTPLRVTLFFCNFPLRLRIRPEQQVILPIAERTKLGKVWLKESRL